MVLPRYPRRKALVTWSADHQTVKHENPSESASIADNSPSFFHLPLELRHMIYTFMFVEAHIVFEPTADSTTHGHKIYLNPPVVRAICLVNRALYLETFPILKRELTTLIVRPKFCGSCNFLCRESRCIPADWRNDIKTIHCTDTVSTRFNTRDFPKLETVELPAIFLPVAERCKPSDAQAPSEILHIAAIEVLGRGSSRLRQRLTLSMRDLDGLDDCGIKVLVRVLHANDLRRQSTGWEAYIDLRTWKIETINKVLLRKIPYPKRLNRRLARVPKSRRAALQQDRREWRTNPANWAVVRYDKMEASGAPAA